MFQHYCLYRNRLPEKNGDDRLSTISALKDDQDENKVKLMVNNQGKVSETDVVSG